MLWVVACRGTSSDATPEQPPGPASSTPEAPAADSVEAPGKLQSAPDPDDVLYFRVGLRGQPAVYETGVKFDPAPPARGAFTVGTDSYSYTLTPRPGSASGPSWYMRFYRGALEDDDKFWGTILHNPVGMTGECHALPELPTNPIWIKIGVRGPHRSAKQACAAFDEI